MKLYKLIAVGVGLAAVGSCWHAAHAQQVQVYQNGARVGEAPAVFNCVPPMQCSVTRKAVQLWSDAGTPSFSGDLTTTDSPSTPSANSLKLAALELGPGALLASMDENGSLMPVIGAGPFWKCKSEQTTNGMGLGAFASVGTGSATAPTSTSFYTSNNPYVPWTSTAGVNQSALIRDGVTFPVPMWRGNASGLGGFWFYSRWGIGSNDTDQRYFSGLYGTAANIAANVDPSTLLDTLYMGCDAADANTSVCSNDGSGTATCTSLGASFPCKTQFAVYDVFFFAPPNGSSVGYLVKRMDSAATASGTLSSNLPTSTVFMRWQQWCSSGPTGAVTGCITTAYNTCLGIR